MKNVVNIFGATSGHNMATYITTSGHSDNGLDIENSSNRCKQN